MRLQDTNCFTKIECAEGEKVPSEIQLLRVGKFRHPNYGNFEITPLVLSDMKKNFDDRVRGIDLALDYFHDSDKEASGWIKDLILKENGTQLWAQVDWTPTAAKKLSDRELRYFSPDFTFKWVDPESGKSYNNVLFGGGLTNRPFVKDMQAIVANENKGVMQMDEKDKMIAELQAKCAELQAKLDAQAQAMPEMEMACEQNKKLLSEKQVLLSEKETLAGEMETLKQENQQLKDEKRIIEKEQEFAKLLSEGKAVVAQKDAFFKGDMAEFVKLAQPINLKPAGTGAAAANEGDDDDKVMKLAETFVKEEKITLGEAISKALKQVKGIK